MKVLSPINFSLGLMLFVAGILLGTLLVGVLVWADIEAVFYGLPHLTNNTFDGLDCPPLMTRTETANLLVTVHNETDRPIAPLIRVEISTPSLMESDREKSPVVEPGQSATLKWPVSEDNIDLDFFIFAKAFRYPDYKTRLAEATCGIFVLDIPFVNGNTLLALWLATSIGGTLAGLWMIEKREVLIDKQTNTLAGLRLIAIVMLIGALTGIQGAWVPGIMLLVVLALLVIALVYFSLSHENPA